MSLSRQKKIHTNSSSYAMNSIISFINLSLIPEGKSPDVCFGASPGKRLLGMTILKIDGSAISYRESFLKILPQTIIAWILFVLQCYIISLADEETFNSLSWMKQSSYLSSFFPFYLLVVMVLSNGFNFTNLIVFLLNERKRSIWKDIRNIKFGTTPKLLGILYHDIFDGINKYLHNE